MLTNLGAVLLTLLMLPANAEPLTLPNLAAPPQGSAQWIARSMRMNGLPMSLKAFESRLSPDAVLSHYESELKSSGSHDVRRSVNAPWRVLMFKSHDHLITVQARPASAGSEGTILVSPALDPAKLKMKRTFRGRRLLTSSICNSTTTQGCSRSTSVYPANARRSLKRRRSLSY